MGRWNKSKQIFEETQNARSQSTSGKSVRRGKTRFREIDQATSRWTANRKASANCSGSGAWATEQRDCPSYHATLDTVNLWRNRWVTLQDISLDDMSIEDRLQDAPRPGTPARITADQRYRIDAQACETPEGSARPITHWTARDIAEEVKKRKIVDTISARPAARLL